MNKRTGFLFLALGALSFLVSGINGKENIPSYKDENTTYLLTIDNSLCGNDEAVKASQDSVLAGLRSTLGFKYSVVNHKDPKVLELESDIAYYENKIHEKQLEIKAFYDELKILEKELAEFNSYERLKEKVIKKVLPVYKEFLENGLSDLTEDFYSVSSKYYDRLDIIRMQCNLNDFKELENIFDSYLEELNEKTALDTSDKSKVKE